MRHLLLVITALTLVGCGTVSLLDDLDAHGCDIASYKANIKRGSVEVVCK